jgi:cysteine desulfurase
VYLNGHPERRVPGNLNLSFAYVEGESLLLSLKDIVALSSGSACTSASREPSYVLRAIGVDDSLAHASIRFGLGRSTTEADIDTVIHAVVEKVTRLRALSPIDDLKRLSS